MFKSMLSPAGTMESVVFLKASVTLTAVGALLLSLKIFVPSIGNMGILLSLLLIYPWVCVWVQRLRQGGKSAFLFSVYAFTYAALFIVFLIGAVLSTGEVVSVMMESARQEISMQEYQAKMENMDLSPTLHNVIWGHILASLVTLFIGDRATPRHVDVDSDT